ncbi:zinc ribbon domain-containing protein [Clostridium sp. BJN0001]|uniref:zinc ribbon domain-containing protein n=1 Tax=Clostridium sp. BJN0001 TaxID=2930219 RepID=UPI001FD0C4D3|nr:zinc ribbon domain-containing protein [Clostridium sp. BJN0001]
MFCKNCGSKIKEGDLFCENCGTPLEDSGSGSFNNSRPFNQNYAQNNITKFFKLYFSKPLSAFGKYKNKDSISISVFSIIIIAILSGLLNFIHGSLVVSSLVSSFCKFPSILAKAGIISQNEALDAITELQTGQVSLRLKQMLDSNIDKKGLFINGIFLMAGTIIITAVILALINATLLKNNISINNIVFISSISYIPLIIFECISCLVTPLSIIIGFIMIAFGYSLSFVSMYKYLEDASDLDKDKLLFVMAIIFIVFAIIIGIVYIKYINSALASFYELIQDFGYAF